MIELYISIGVISGIVWFIVPFFQRNSKYFYYFAVLGASAIYGIIALIVPIGIPTRTWLAVSILIIPGLFRDFFRERIFLIIIAAIMLYFATYLINIQLIQKISLFGFIVAELIIIYRMSVLAKQERKINFFYIILFVYGLLNILKITFLISFLEKSLPIYFTITILQAVIGVIFYFIRENNNKLIFKV